MTDVLARTTRPSIPLACSGWAALAATLLPSGSPIRSAAVGVFMLIGPGWALLRHWSIRDGLERFVLAIGLSVAAAMFVGEAQIVVHLWQPYVSLAVLALLTTVASLAPVPLRTSRSAFSD